MNIVIVGCGNVGCEAAKILAAPGNVLLLIDSRLPEHLECVIERDAVQFCQCDATDCAAFKRIIDLFVKEVHGIDALICTVGAPGTSTAQISIDGFRADFNVNFLGNLVPVKAVLDGMIRRKSGKIIVVSSTSGVFTYRSLSAYQPSKWALTAFCGALRSELAEFGVHLDIFFPKTIRNKYSDAFVHTRGIDSECVARLIAIAVNRHDSRDYFVPKYYCLLRPLERLFPNLLDRKSGLETRRKRQHRFCARQVESVLITGASQGLGRELSLLYSKTAKEMHLVARNYERLLQIKSEIARTSGCVVHVASVDMGDPRSIAEYVRKLGHVDLIINNAASAVVGRVSDISVDVYTQSCAGNLFGPVQIIGEFLNRDDRPLKIINVLSTTAIAGRQGHSCYSAGKAALWAFTRGLRRTIGNEVQVMEVLPSTFSSGFSENALRIGGRSGETCSRMHKRLISKILTVQNLTSARVAQVILDAEREGKEVVFIPFRSRLLLLLDSLCPVISRRIFR